MGFTVLHSKINSNHIYGWNWIGEKLKNLDCDSELIFDAFADISFYNNFYKSDWVGIFHYPLAHFKEYIEKNKNFKKSSIYCKGS